MNVALVVLAVVSFTIGAQTKLATKNWENSIIDCVRNYRKVGCFRDQPFPKRVFPVHPYRLRPEIKWPSWPASLHRLTCKCAALAQESSSTHFGLQFYGECWVGNMTVTPQAKTAIQNNCIGHNGVNLFPGPCGPKDEWECVGEHLSNYVYRLTPGPSKCEKALNLVVAVRYDDGEFRQKRTGKFLRTLVRMFSRMKLLLIVYGQRAEVRVKFNEDARRINFTEKVEDIGNVGTGRREDKAMEVAQQQFSLQAMLRNSKPNVMVVLTTRPQKPGNKFVYGPVSVQGKDVPVFAIGVGRSKEGYLLEIAQRKSDHVLEVPSYNFLLGRMDHIVPAICSAV